MDILAPRQLFTYALDNIEPHTIERAKKEMGSCASEMGFSYGAETDFKVEKYFCQDTQSIKYRLEATFNA